MASVVVHHEVNVQIVRHVLVDVLQEGKELLMPMAVAALAQDLSGRHIQRGEQSQRPMTNVVVSDPST